MNLDLPDKVGFTRLGLKLSPSLLLDFFIDICLYCVFGFCLGCGKKA